MWKVRIITKIRRYPIGWDNWVVWYRGYKFHGFARGITLWDAIKLALK